MCWRFDMLKVIKCGHKRRLVIWQQHSSLPILHCSALPYLFKVLKESTAVFTVALFPVVLGFLVLRGMTDQGLGDKVGWPGVRWLSPHGIHGIGTLSHCAFVICRDSES